MILYHRIQIEHPSITVTHSIPTVQQSSTPVYNTFFEMHFNLKVDKSKFLLRL